MSGPTASDEDPYSAREGKTVTEVNNEAVRRVFVGADGRWARIPAKRSKRLVLLDRLAQEFELGQIYSEPEVNAIARLRHDDVAAVRRYLVDEGFLDRRDGFYWRSGGTVDI
ncbi:MAG: DUF2087 domain-containing protein [Actinomycetota bacterium]|nr:DUF2087 domain-containing protein [Nocardioidaceae bacterium]MDQ3591301.1 DUF2087 domain-containing protein [Actinomycetota bacterium]